MGCSTNTQPIQDLQYRYFIDYTINWHQSQIPGDEQDAGLKVLILAIPVGPPDTVKQLGKEADQVICLSTSRLFWAVGTFCAVFDQTPDEEVKWLLGALP